MRRASKPAPECDFPNREEGPANPQPSLALLRFGQLEGRIMRALWSFGEVTLDDLHRLLADAAISQPVLRSMLEKLHLKRLVRTRKLHHTRFYRAAHDQTTFIRLLRSQLSGFLGESGLSLLLADSDL